MLILQLQKGGGAAAPGCSFQQYPSCWAVQSMRCWVNCSTLRPAVLHASTVLQDHFPGDYENLLRDDVAKKERPPTPAPASNGNAQPAADRK